MCVCVCVCVCAQVCVCVCVCVFKLSHLQPEFVVDSITDGGDALECGVLSGIHLHIPQTQEVRRFICIRRKRRQHMTL